jgi:ATP-dependent Clp protease ATP-binding subunit ClpA
MFERFTQDARQSVVSAQEEARRMRNGHIGGEHLLLGLLIQHDGPAAQSLAAAGLDIEGLRVRVAAATHGDDLDSEALASLGIDLDAVRRSTEAAFGPGALDRGRASVRGHIPFTPEAKKSLELALREALKLKHSYISTGHILLGVLRAGDNTAMRVLEKADINVQGLREDVTRRLAKAA